MLLWIDKYMIAERERKTKFSSDWAEMRRKGRNRMQRVREK